jgi:hypothetical protein
MVSTSKILEFCDKTKFFTSKPEPACLVEAAKLDAIFGDFIRIALTGPKRFSSTEEFLKCYTSYAAGNRVIYS